LRILVTGATGFVGAVLMPLLVARYGEEAVSAFVLPKDRIPSSWTGSRVRLFEGDIADRRDVESAVDGHSHVVNLAGFISYWRGEAERLERVNVDGVYCVVEACLRSSVRRLIHVSSVGAVGFHRDGRLADETTPFNWPPAILYMTSKRQGQGIVERAVKERRLPAVILNPASIIGPGDHNRATPHNQLYQRVCCRRLIGSFAGGLAVVDVRDLVAIILKALEGQGKDGESYLVVGANLAYPEVIRLISQACDRKAYPVRLPAFIFTLAGIAFEQMSRLTGRRPLLTAAYGRLSGWTAHYDNTKSRAAFNHSYIDVQTSIRDGWDFFRDTFGCTSKPRAKKRHIEVQKGLFGQEEKL
jgi:dihydroflavonol-4-reductase